MKTDLNELQRAVKNHVANTGLVFLWDNQSYIPEPPYVDVQVVIVSSDAPDLLGEDEHFTGYLSLVVVVTKGSSTEHAYSMLDVLRASFNPKQRIPLSSGRVQFRQNLSPSGAGYSTDTDWRLPARVPFTT